MASITLEQIRHSYLSHPKSAEDYALKRIDLTWDDGGAYALLGSSGCGKSTMLNIISGLIQPTEGRILFDQRDVTAERTEQRHIAQVFQFPVVYDTMTVRQNLAFPLKNRGVAAAIIQEQVARVAAMLDLESMLDKRAAGLTADGKQKISLGRGLIRQDVNAILFDEPLTVIDPHLKWQLRSKLKELHQQFGATMIYVTHDQTEAMTFADKVVVMHEGEVVQSGTPQELFEAPGHTFVGHFIGSPGMNVLPLGRDGEQFHFDGTVIDRGSWTEAARDADALEIGIRPEFVSFAATGVPVEVVKVSDVGRHRIVETRHGDQLIRAIVAPEIQVPDSQAHLQFEPSRICLYGDSWLKAQGAVA